MAQVMAEIGLSIALVWALCDLFEHPNSKTGIVMLVAIAWFLLADGAYAQTEIEAPFPTVMQNGVPLPDWNKISFDSLPRMQEAGSISISADTVQQLGFDPSASWKAGDSVTDVLKAGSIKEMGVGEFDMKSIDALSGQNSSGLPLSQFDPMKLQDIGSLNNAVPGLGDLKIAEVSPIADRVSQALSTGEMKLGAIGDDLFGGGAAALPGGGNFANLGNLANMSIKDAVASVPYVGSLDFSKFDLSKYSFASIPNLDATKLGNLQQFEDTFLKGVPGLGKVPLAKFPNPLGEGTNPYIARMDVPLGNDEQNRQRTVSGSYQAGFRVPCEKGCEHVELSPIDGSQSKNPISMFANGVAWISGKAQKVEGGFGVLKAVGGGQEPTGRNPYGSVFKQVVTKVDAPKGKVSTSLYFRLCKRGNPDLGCTPYLIGPIPFFTYPEKMLVYLGEANPSDDGKGLEVGSNNPPGQTDPLSAQDGFDAPCGGTASVASGAAKKAIATVDKVAAKLSGGDSAFATSSANGAKHIPLIMDALAKEGIKDPAQVAYVLATVNRETSFVNFVEGAGTRYISSGGTAYYGRGYVQLTHKDAYAKATVYLRSKGYNVDLVKNPELASQPQYAAPILAYGMKTGSLYGDGMTLGKCAGGGKVDWVSCRRIVNDGAQAGEIASAAKLYYDAIKGEAPATPSTSTGNQACKPEEIKKSDGYINPLQGKSYVITSDFGFRQCPVHGPENHSGIDMGIGGGTPVLAAKEGTVSAVGLSCGGPNSVQIKHPDGNSTQYLHLSSKRVSVGMTVQKGQPIGAVGTMGCSTGNHLHYGFVQGGANVNPRKTGVKI